MPTPPETGPLVSVVLATNRGGPFLAEALGSVLAQTYPRVEVVVVDDGSPDPGALAAAVGASRDVRLVRTARSGVSGARNAGVRLTAGELVAFIDDDDRWGPDRLARHVAAMAGGAVLSYCGMRTIDAVGDVLVQADQGPVDGLADVVRRSGWILVPNLVVRRSAFDEVGGFDESLGTAEDLDLVLRVAQLGSCVYVDETLVDYRYHGANATRAHRELAASIRRVLASHRAIAARQGRDDVVAAYVGRLRDNDRFAAWSAARAARAALRERHLVAAARELAWAARFAPLAPVWWLRTRLARRGASR